MTELLAFLEGTAEKGDPIRDTVMTFLASYGGLAAGVTFLVSALKKLWRKGIKGREPVITILLAYVLGVAAKFVTPFYGDPDARGWILHCVILLFVAVGSAAFHDKVVNALMGKGGKK